MKETEAQQLIIDAVKADDLGGNAIKFNNQFVIGVPDLLIKPVNCQPMILEAKLHRFSQKTLDMGHLIADVGCTKLQKDDLRDWGRAGMLTGVASFVMLQGGNVSTLRLALYSYEEMLKRHWSVHTRDHVALGEKSERLFNIRELLTRFAND